MPMIMREYDLNLNQASLMMSVFTIVPLILAIPTGVLVKKTGPIKMFIIAIVFVVIGSMIGAFSDSASVLVFSRGLEGVGMVFCMIAGPITIQTFVAPERRGSALGFLGINISVGSFLGGSITPTLYDKINITGVWLTYAVLCVISLIIVLLCFKGKSIRVENNEDRLEVKDEAGAESNNVRFTVLFKPNIILFLFGYLFWNLGVLGVLTFAPSFMQSQGVDPTVSGSLSSLPNLLSIIICPIFGLLADKTGKIKLLVLVSAICIAPGCFLLMTTTNWPVWIGIFFLTIGMSVPTMSMIILPKLLPSSELLGIGMGFLNVFANGGMLLGTIVPALIIGFSNGSWLMVGVSLLILSLIGAVCYFSVKMKETHPHLSDSMSK